MREELKRLQRGGWGWLKLQPLAWAVLPVHPKPEPFEFGEPVMIADAEVAGRKRDKPALVWAGGDPI